MDVKGTGVIAEPTISVQGIDRTGPGCLCCGSASWETYARLPKLIFGKRAMISRCQSCGFGRTVPEPETLVDYYANNDDFVTQLQERCDDYRSFAKSLLADLPFSTGNGKRLLDVGCGGGFLLEEAQKLGFHAYGVDANATMVRWCHARALNVVLGDVSRLQCDLRFHVVVVSAVLEHLRDPAGLLLAVSRILEKGGLVLVSQASFDGLLPYIAPWGWYGWQPKEHFWHFTPSSFQKFAERNGFTCASVRRSLHHSWYWTGKDILRNPLTAIAKLGALRNQGDSFNAILQPRAPGA